jgi:hypothetical protein
MQSKPKAYFFNYFTEEAMLKFTKLQAKLGHNLKFKSNYVFSYSFCLLIFVFMSIQCWYIYSIIDRDLNLFSVNIYHTYFIYSLFKISILYDVTLYHNKIG